MRIIFAGTPEFAAAHLNVLIDSGHEVCAVLTQPDRPAGRGKKLMISPVKEIALSHNIPCLQPLSLKKDIEIIKKLEAFSADIFVVVAYGLFLPASVLYMKRYGCINVHASLLPRWRGASPIQHAILAGDKVSGVSIMQMDEGMDTGPVLCSSEYTLDDRETAETLHNRLMVMGCHLLLEALDGLAKGKLVPKAQDESLMTYAPKIKKEDAKLDFSKPADALERQIRAYNPWPVCYTTFGDQTFRIWDARVAEEACFEGSFQQPYPAGSIVKVDATGLFIATGQGVLQVTRLQRVGGKVLPVAEFLNGHREFFEKS